MRTETIEVMMGDDLDTIMREKYGSEVKYTVISAYSCDTGGGCDYCSCSVVEIEER